MNQPFVVYKLCGRIATLTLNRPGVRNAIGTHQDCLDFVAAVRAAQEDDSISCLILTGAGTAFCAGGNLKAMKERNGIGPLQSPDATRANYRRGVQSIITALWECEVPTIAAINGPAIGLGLDIACLCDIRVSTDQAKFASSFIKLGIVPGDGGAWILPRAVGLSKAAELIFTGGSLTRADPTPHFLKLWRLDRAVAVAVSAPTGTRALINESRRYVQYGCGGCTMAATRA